MNPYEAQIRQAREEKFSDEQIFNQLKSMPDFQEKYAEAEKSGINPNDIDKFVTKNYGLKPEKPKTMLQKVYSALSYNPIAEGIESLVGENPVSQGLKEVSSAFANAPAALLALPRSLVDAPGNLVKSSEEFSKNQPGREAETWGDYLDPEVRNPNLIRGITDPVAKGIDYGLEQTGIKGLVDQYLPNYEETSNYFRQEKDNPKTGVGQFAERTVGGLVTAGPIGAVAGAADYVGEQLGFSPEYRAIMSMAMRKKDQGYPKTIYGEILPAEPINSPNELAARLLTYDSDSLNIPVLKAAAEMNLPIESIPLQALYKNGLPNLMEGIAQNSLIGASRFSNIMDNFSEDMSGRLNRVIESMPVDEGANQVTTIEQLGEKNFDNPLPILFTSAAPQLEVPKHVTGSIGKNAIQRFDESITSQYENAYKEVKFTKNDLLKPESREYLELKNEISNVKKKLSSKGFQGGERKEALNVLSEINSLFEYKKDKEGNRIKDENGKPIPLPIKLENIRKNIQDLNKTINYEFPSLVNLIEPVAKNMRSLLQSYAESTENLKSLAQANKLFKQKADIFNDPLMKKLHSMTDEQFYRTVKNNPSYMKKIIEFGELTGQTGEINQLKGQIMGDILEKALKATSPKELVSGLSDSVIKQIRELEPMYPELKGLSTSLQLAKRKAQNFSSPKEMAKSNTRQIILDDIMSASGMEKTMKIMSTPEGIDLVRETLKGNKQGETILKNLERKKIEQALYKGPQKQEITLVEMGEVFKDSKTDAILKKLLSPENYNEAKNLSKIAEEYQKGLAAHQKIKQRFDLGAGGVGTLAGLFISPVKTVIGVGTLAYYLTSKNFRKLMAENAQRKYAESQKSQ